MSEADSLRIINQLATGYWLPRCLHLIAEFGVADLIDDAPRTAQALAGSIGAHPEALGRVLRALSAQGVFEEVAGGFRHTGASRLLRTDHPRSQRAFVRMMGLPVHWAAYGALGHSIRTGEAAFTQVASGGTFDYFVRHRDEGLIFDEAMTGKSHEQIAAALGAYDFSAFGRIGDIGGGRGHLLRAVLASAPRAQGVLFDLPPVVEAASAIASERISLQPGSFFEDPLPACDAYLLMSVIHDWDDARAVDILTAVRSAAPAHAKLLLFELLIPEEIGAHPAKFLDIEMLVMTSGGRERTRPQFEQLYRAAGWRLERVIPTAAATVILEGVTA